MTRDYYNARRAAHWDGVARRWRKRKGLGEHYQRRLQRGYRFLIPPNSKVLDLGYDFGDLLMILDADLTVPPRTCPAFTSPWPRERGS